ncbi:hypothetical protein [Chelatococcus sp. XZ-Ab1]|uniref:OTU domain-containing protein n=1 Tax=Chelatococcus sp. XZ-Ab1 TaxID=3034027 RepID=UPI0023E3E22D|nr:hypothetical protein [Chelatococcus sp. XZ-Ab1]
MPIGRYTPHDLATFNNSAPAADAPVFRPDDSTGFGRPNWRSPAFRPPDARTVAMTERLIAEAQQQMEAMFPDLRRTPSSGDELPPEQPATATPSARSRRSGQYGSNAAPCRGANLLADARQNMPTRLGVALAILQRAGLDPEREYAFSDPVIVGIGGATIRGKQRLVDLYMQAQIQALPFFSRDFPQELKNLPDLDSRFEEEFSEHIVEQAANATARITDTLSAAGMDVERTQASVLSFDVKRMGWEHGGLRPGVSVEHASRGYVLKVAADAEPLFLAVVPGDPALILRMPADHAGQKSWLSGHMCQFFEKPVPPLDPLTDYVLKEVDSGITLREAVAASSLRIFEDLLLPLKNEAFAETTYEQLVHAARGGTIPGYDPVREWQQGNHKTAVALGALDAAPPVLEMAGKLRLPATVARTIGTQADALTQIGKGAKGVKTAAGRIGKADPVVDAARAGRLADTRDALAKANGMASPVIDMEQHLRRRIEVTKRGQRYFVRLRTGGSGAAPGSTAPGARRADPARILRETYETAGRIRQGSGRVLSADEIARIIDRRANRPIPDRLYRGQTGSGITSTFDWSGEDAQDRYLAAIIEHAGSYSGAEHGKVPSLTMTEATAEYFARGRPDAKVWVVDTRPSPRDFRTIEDILKNDGPRLVRDGKLSKQVLAKAVGLTVTNQWEDEVFFVRGSIPADWTRLRGPKPLPRPLADARRYAADSTPVAGVRPADGGALPAVTQIADFLEVPGNWNAAAGDYAPTAIANALGRELVLRDYPASGKSLSVVPHGPVSGPAVELVYSPGHYDAYIAGKLHRIQGDGDCLFRAALASMNQNGAVSDGAVAGLRRLAAQEIRNNPGHYAPFIGRP